MANLFRNFRRNPHLVILLVALVVGSFLRLYRIGEIPYGFTWDEAAITYDAWGIADWHRDQYATFMPWVFKSYGDYKAPFLIYLLATTFFVTGVNELTIRLLSALAGIALIPIAYFLGKRLFPTLSYLPSIGALFVAVSPWHVPMSRVGYEANIATTLVALGVLLFLDLKRWWFAVFGALFLSASLYAYQSTKIATPLLFGVLLVGRWFLLKKKIQFTHLTIPLLVFILGLLPLYWTFQQGGAERGRQALIFFENGEVVSSTAIFTRLGENIVTHFSPAFLWQGKQESLRHLVPGFGVLFVLDVVLVITALVFGRRRKVVLFLVLWTFLCLLPSMVSRGEPNAIRAAQAVTPLLLLSTFGLLQLIKQLKFVPAKLIVCGLIGIAFFVSSAGFATTYFEGYPKAAAIDFQYGYKEALEIAKKQTGVQKFVMTDAYKQPYIYALLYQRYTPEEFQAGALANFMFKPIKWPEYEKKTVYIGTPQEIPETDPKVVGLVKIPGTETTVFVVAKND